jgi:hypothetical protein
MARMIPESLNRLSRVTAGEARLFRLLQQKLDDRCYVWYDLPVRGRYADFIVLDPNRGLLVLEVKDWRLSQIREITPSHVTLETPRGEKQLPNPVRQARDYALSVADALSSDPLLIRAATPYSPRLAIPFGYGVVWTRIDAKAFRDAAPDLFEPSMLFRDALSSDDLADRLFALLPYPHPVSLTEAQIDRIRYHIFPEIRLPRPRATQLKLVETAPTVAVMDLEQERLAKSLGEGHRLVRGVAGSGKTITLVCRARLLAELHPTWRVLVLCYNVSLASYLRQLISRSGAPRPGSIRVTNYHAFLASLMRDAGLERASSRAWASEASETLCDLASRGKWTPPRYDAVLVDEAHDFEDSWLRLAVRCVNPETESLFVAHDSAQNIYRKGFSFSRVGVKIRGRTKILRTNYRNTREIAELASSFLARGVDFEDAESLRDDEGQFLEIIRPQSTLRSGPRPQLVRCESFREECAETAARVKHWIERGHYPANEILVLYVKRGTVSTDDRYIRALLGALDEAGVPYEWIARDQHSKRGLTLDSATVKVSTIHSAKGLDFAAVAMVGVSLLPSSPASADAERKLVYVGLTRARESLFITWCKESQFVRELIEGAEC